MSPIKAIDEQKRMRELGRIRLGARGPKGEPRRLTTFRLTTYSRDLAAAVASIYGGKVAEWKGAPSEGAWEVYTEATQIQVTVPPGQVLTQWYEMWSGGGCLRRCTGEQDTLAPDGLCTCPEDNETRAAMAQDGKACKPTTRLSVMLHDVPDLGTWRLESHGYYAAVEMAGIMAVLEHATSTGALVPASLRIESRQTKTKGSTRNYIVPVLEVLGITPAQFATEYALAGALPEATPALPAPPASIAPPAEPAPAPKATPAAPQPAPAAKALEGEVVAQEPDPAEWVAITDWIAAFGAARSMTTAKAVWDSIPVEYRGRPDLLDAKDSAKSRLMNPED